MCTDCGEFEVKRVLERSPTVLIFTLVSTLRCSLTILVM